MWVTRQDSADFQQEYCIEGKILDARSDQNTLEIFKSALFGEIALLNEKQLWLKNLLFQESELLAHIPLCAHPEPKKLLLAGSFNLEIAFEALRHDDLEVHLLQNDLKILHSFISFFPHYQETMNHPRFRVIEELVENHHYDVILYTDTPSFSAVEPYIPLLSDTGILITRLENLLLYPTPMRDHIAALARFFPIAMPFASPFSLLANSHFLFASRRYHPTADLLLQKADMLEGLQAYHARVQESAFVLPRFLEEGLAGVIKN